MDEDDAVSRISRGIIRLPASLIDRKSPRALIVCLFLSSSLCLWRSIWESRFNYRRLTIILINIFAVIRFVNFHVISKQVCLQMSVLTCKIEANGTLGHFFIYVRRVLSVWEKNSQYWSVQKRLRTIGQYNGGLMRRKMFSPSRRTWNNYSRKKNVVV